MPHMLNVTARQELMRTIVDTLGVVVEEARLDFGKDGLSVRVVDPSHVATILFGLGCPARKCVFDP